MPELPEVETIKNDLRPEVEGRRFSDVSIMWPRMVLRPPVEELRQRLPGQTIREVARRGKHLIFRLGSGQALVLHLRMTGAILLAPGGDMSPEQSRYVRATFRLDDGRELRFHDKRKLGTVSLVDDESELDAKLGPEPLSTDFTLEVLKERLGRRKAPIKAVLCDQKLVAGIGNMYADEALFFAGIHPLGQASILTTEETGRLHRAIGDVLTTAIGNAGATFSDYRRPGGESGSQQHAFYVAHRGGQTCKVCSTPIERIPVRNRGTYFCPVCQRPATCS
jgi:formamidopyrimidine-DNA glycosylase